MRLAFDEFWPVLALLLLRQQPPAATPPPSSLPGTLGNELQRTRTGEADLLTWFQRRFGLALESLAGLGLPSQLLRPVALSIVAQWAHETGRGKSEFNFNLGGWRARRSDPFFVARDVQTGAELFRWTAYPNIETAVADQIKRLSERFPTAWAKLLAQPNTSAWIEELGRKGYYVAPPGRSQAEHIQAYARAWAMNRAELERLAP